MHSFRFKRKIDIQFVKQVCANEILVKSAKCRNVKKNLLSMNSNYFLYFEDLIQKYIESLEKSARNDWRSDK